MSSLGARKVALVQASFELVAALGVNAADIFYAELFAIDPSLRAMFKGDMQDQQRKLVRAMEPVVRSLRTPESLLDFVTSLAVKEYSERAPGG
jgi:hemoglobin-like flavoprotein